MDLEEKILKMLATELARAKQDSENLKEEDIEAEGLARITEFFDIIAA